MDYVVTCSTFRPFSDLCSICSALIADTGSSQTCGGSLLLMGNSCTAHIDVMTTLTHEQIPHSCKFPRPNADAHPMQMV